MADRLTDEALRTLLAKASPGPWRMSDDRFEEELFDATGETIMAYREFYPSTPYRDQDWDLIALAPTLAAEVLELRARVAELEARQ